MRYRSSRLPSVTIDPSRSNSPASISSKPAQGPAAPFAETSPSPAASFRRAISLIPGNPLEALSRSANSLLGTELVIISANQIPARSPAWFYLPRTLSTNALVLREEPTAEGRLLKPINRVDLQHLAHQSAPRRRARIATDNAASRLKKCPAGFLCP